MDAFPDIEKVKRDLNNVQINFDNLLGPSKLPVTSGSQNYPSYQSNSNNYSPNQIVSSYSGIPVSTNTGYPSLTSSPQPQRIYSTN